MRISDWSSDVCSSDLPQDDGVDRAGFLAQPAIDAFHHVDIVARRPAAAVGAWLGFDGDRLRRADRLAQLAGDATLLTAGTAPQRELTPEARALRALFIQIGRTSCRESVSPYV